MAPFWYLILNPFVTDFITQLTPNLKLIEDFDEILTEQWPCSILGCYLSKVCERMSC